MARLLPEPIIDFSAHRDSNVIFANPAKSFTNPAFRLPAMTRMSWAH